MRVRYIIAVLVLTLIACSQAPTPTGPDGRPAPTRVVPDPNPVGSAGRNKNSVLMYASWERNYTKNVRYQNGTLDADGNLDHEFEQRAQSLDGGEVFIVSPYRPKTLYIIEVWPLFDVEDRGLTTCWILWDNKIQDRGANDSGAVECDWLTG